MPHGVIFIYHFCLQMTQAEMTVNKLMGLMNDRHRRLTETDTESGQQYTRVSHM